MIRQNLSRLLGLAIEDNCRCNKTQGQMVAPHEHQAARSAARPGYTLHVFGLSPSIMQVVK